MFHEQEFPSYLHHVCFSNSWHILLKKRVAPFMEDTHVIVSSHWCLVVAAFELLLGAHFSQDLHPGKGGAAWTLQSLQKRRLGRSEVERIMRWMPKLIGWLLYPWISRQWESHAGSLLSMFDIGPIFFMWEHQLPHHPESTHHFVVSLGHASRRRSQDGPNVC